MYAIIEEPLTADGYFYYDILTSDFVDLGFHQVSVWLIYGDDRMIKSKRPIGVDVTSEFDECTNI